MDYGGDRKVLPPLHLQPPPTTTIMSPWHIGGYSSWRCHIRPPTNCCDLCWWFLLPPPHLRSPHMTTNESWWVIGDSCYLHRTCSHHIQPVTTSMLWFNLFVFAILTMFLYRYYLILSIMKHWFHNNPTSDWRDDGWLDRWWMTVQWQRMGLRPVTATREMTETCDGIQGPCPHVEQHVLGHLYVFFLIICSI